VIDSKSAASEFLQQAEGTLEDARILLAENRPAGVINRAYYAAFYAACALLDSAGLKANSHQAAISLLHREFVRPEKLDRDLMRAYTGLFEARMSGDYGPFSSATSEAAKDAFDTAARFIDTVKKHLQI
jgi:uncharacterized protein (UPF0332 family)